MLEKKEWVVGVFSIQKREIHPWIGADVDLVNGTVVNVESLEGDIPGGEMLTASILVIQGHGVGRIYVRAATAEEGAEKIQSRLRDYMSVSCVDEVAEAA